MNMTSRQQNLLALVCGPICQFLHRCERVNRDTVENYDYESEVKKLGGEIADLVLDTKFREWDDLYEKLHRTGANL
jgi:hypothetical protein